MSRERRTDPLAAPVAALCRDGDTLLGAWPLAELPRLGASLSVPPAADERVGWQARFSQVEPVGILHLVWQTLSVRDRRVPAKAQGARIIVAIAVRNVARQY